MTDFGTGSWNFSAAAGSGVHQQRDQGRLANEAAFRPQTVFIQTFLEALRTKKTQNAHPWEAQSGGRQPRELSLPPHLRPKESVPQRCEGVKMYMSRHGHEMDLS